MTTTRREAAVAVDEDGSASEATATAYGGRRYSAAEKRALIDEFEQSDETFGEFCARHGLSTASLCKWRKAVRERGEAGLIAREPRRNAVGHTGRARSPEERRQAIEAFAKSGLTQQTFARTWGISIWTLREWLKRYRRDGPKGLEPAKRGPHGPRSSPSPLVPDEVKAEIARTKQRFPSFGLKKVRDFLARFSGVRVSTGTVARTLEERGIAREIHRPKKKRSRPLPRRFERSRPGELWQTDITSFVIGRSHMRVYLIVFLDDYSRFVVSHGLYVYQRGEIARETLLIGIGRYGKPKEVLSDQGRQYFAWRGKAFFQKLLAKQGIHHAVARAHHPQTVGKCERLWKTLKSEFLDRVELEDLPDARERIEHFFAHYNFFRPHQGIGGLVPADRFFGAESALRTTQEARLARDELARALEVPQRTSAYLFGQIGDTQVSAHGEKGSLVVHTSSGLREQIGLENLGAPSAPQRAEQQHGSDDDGKRERGANEAATSNGQEAAALHSAAADAAGRETIVAERVERRTAASAPDVRADPVDVARQADARGSGGALVDSSAARVATEPTSSLGYARGTLETAPQSTGQGDFDAALERGRSAGLEETDRTAGEGRARSRRPDSALGDATQTDEWAAGIFGDACGEKKATRSEPS